jgi:hypothetical protein
MELSQNANSAAVLLLYPDTRASAVAWAIFMFLGTISQPCHKTGLSVEKFSV